MKIIVFIMSLFLYLQALSLNYTKTNWALNIPASTTEAGIIYLPTEVTFEALQNTLADNDQITVYTIATSSKVVEGLIGRRLLPKIIITKNDIKYELIDYGKDGKNRTVTDYATFDEFKTSISNIDIPTNKNWFLNNYIGYLDKIHLNGVYYIKAPNGFNINMKFDISNVSSSFNNGFKTPPQTPNLNNNPSSQSDNNNSWFPPIVPNLNTTNN